METPIALAAVPLKTKRTSASASRRPRIRSAARAVVSLPEASVDEFLALCAKRGVPVTRLGEVTAEPVLDFGVLSLGLDEARDAWLAPIPAALG